MIRPPNAGSSSPLECCTKPSGPHRHTTVPSPVGSPSSFTSASPDSFLMEARTTSRAAHFTSLSSAWVHTNYSASAPREPAARPRSVSLSRMSA